MYMYSGMFMKIEYLPPVVVQVVMDKVSWEIYVRRDIQCTCTVECT